MNISKLGKTKMIIQRIPNGMIRDLNSRCRDYLKKEQFPPIIDEFSVGLRTLQLKFMVPRLLALKHRIFEEMKNET